MKMIPMCRGQATWSVCGRQKGAALMGANPADRGLLTSNFHLMTEQNKLAVSLGISGADVHDSLGLESLVRGIAPIRSRRGRPRRRRPAKLHPEKGYDCDHLR
ncbi:hypothetical protein ACFXPW_08310 [Streptomyces goshikiensis]|uniref:hypothetical protein n=1 Tax=Streptomyces goshikiensis TaxID=1942 RepID=UPI0036A7C099